MDILPIYVECNHNQDEFWSINRCACITKQLKTIQSTKCSFPPCFIVK